MRNRQAVEGHTWDYQRRGKGMTACHECPWSASSCTDATTLTLAMSPEQEEGSGRKSYARQGALREELLGSIGRDAASQQTVFEHKEGNDGMVNSRTSRGARRGKGDILT